MDYDDLYDYEFGRLVFEAQERYRIASSHSARFDSGLGSMFDLGNHDEGWSVQKTHYRIIRDFVPNVISDLIIMMLDRGYCRSGATAVKALPGALEDSKCQNLAPHFALITEAETVGYVCCSHLPQPKQLAALGTYATLRRQAADIRKHDARGLLAQTILDANDPNRSPDLDGITCLLLDDPSCRVQNAGVIMWSNECASRQSKSLQIPVRYELFSDFFSARFGEDELGKLYDRIRDCETKMRDIAGVGTISVPSSSRMDDFREECLQSVIEDTSGYREELIRLGFADDDLDGMFKRYFDQGYYAASVGGSEFADSFISSEWFRGLHRYTHELDQTGTVAGYIKSIEQLLYLMVKQWRGQGKTVPTSFNKKTKTYDSFRDLDDYSEDELQKLPLWNLAHFFDPKIGNDALYTGRGSSNALLRMLRRFTGQDRNGYFHKHNLHCTYRAQRIEPGRDEECVAGNETNDLERIRQEVMLLHFAILGSCKINEGCRRSLMLRDWEGLAPGVDMSFLSRVTQWVRDSLANPVVSYRLKKEELSIVFDFGIEVKSDADIMVIVRGKGSYWRAKIGLQTEEAKDWQLREADRVGGQLVWKEELSYDDAFGALRESLIGQDWPSILPRGAECTRIMLANKKHDIVSIWPKTSPTK